MSIKFPGFSQVANERFNNTTLPTYLRTVEECATREYQMLALIKAVANTFMNQGGAGFDWGVRFKNHQVEGFDGDAPMSAAPTNLYKRAQLPYRGYKTDDAIKEFEVEGNKGDAAIVKVYDTMLQRMTESMNFRLGTECWVDGNASGNTTSWHGINSLFGTPTQSITVTTNVLRTINAADPFLAPNATYAGLSTALGAEGGGDIESGVSWPLGRSATEYDFWSPIIMNYNSTNATLLNGATANWGVNCSKAMRTAIMYTGRNTTPSQSVSNILLAPDLYKVFLDYYEAKQRLIPNASPTSLLKLGFTNVLNFDGVEVSLDHSVDPGIGYGFNPRNIELRCMYKELYKFTGPVEDHDNNQFKFYLRNLSNFKFKSPRNFFKLVAATTAT